MPGVYRDPGVNAGYNSGRSSMQRAVAHYTVGADSRSVAERGYFHFLVHQDASREGGCTQYAEVDAITWHAADAGNPYGPGVEWERLVTGPVGPEGLSEAQPLTQNQIDWGKRLIDFFAEWGIPPQLYDGPRYQAGGWNGWVNHQSIDSQRSDGLTRAEWDAMTGGSEAPVTDYDGSSEDEMLLVTMERDGMFCKKGHLYLLDSLGCVDIDPEPASNFNRTPQGIVSAGTLDTLIGDRLNRGIALGLIKE
jgi:hypothetical protein